MLSVEVLPIVFQYILMEVKFGAEKGGSAGCTSIGHFPVEKIKVR